jgi:hypothetical protein
MVANMGAAVGSSRVHCVQKLFQFPVSVAAIVIFGSLSASDNVNSVIFKSGMAENMRVEVGIAAPSLTVQKLFALPS